MKVTPSLTLSFLALLATPLVADETLREKLAARSAESTKSGDPAVQAAYARGIEAVAKSGILDRVKKIGDKAPDFSLKNAAGTEVKLSELLKSGPVVLTWYRGGWCPYCNIALAALQEKLPEITAAGARLVALTPELPDKSLSTKEENALTFDVLTDLNHAVARQYGIVFELTPEVRDLYKRHFDLTEFNGADAGAGTLPLAATYIIGTDGVILSVFVDADYRKRAEPAEIVAALEKLKP